MRNVVLFMHMSLDGYVKARGKDASGKDKIPRRLRKLGQNIVCHGGVRTAQALARLNLVDEYQLIVRPGAIGEGEPLFGKLQQRLNLELL
jgi:dihydrofolate reductase